MLNSTIRVVWVGGDTSIRRNLRERLAQADGIRVIAASKNEGQILALMAQHQPDVVVVSTRIPSSKRIELIRQLRAKRFTAGILVLVLSEDVPFIKAAIGAGANGYILESAPIEEIVEAVRAVQEANQVLLEIRRYTGNGCLVYTSRDGTP